MSRVLQAAPASCTHAVTNTTGTAHRRVLPEDGKPVTTNSGMTKSTQQQACANQAYESEKVNSHGQEGTGFW